MKGFKNVNVYVEKLGIIKTNIGFEDGKIVFIGNDDNSIDEIAKLSDRQVVVPGFIDEHIHGANNFDAMDGSAESIEGIAVALACEGTTGFLATTMTQSEENICKALSSINEYRSKKSHGGAEVIGVHLEGPFISPKHVGAQPLEYVVDANCKTFEKYQKASGNCIKLVSIAPEIKGAEELIKYLSKFNVIASIAHTGANYNQVQQAIEWGVTNVTHTYNAQTALHHRDVGVVGSALLEDVLNCELISDTIHVSIPAIKLIIKNKPYNKVCLITDAMRAKYLEDGEYDLGGQNVIVKAGEARLKDGTLAGSVLKMNEAIKNMVEKALLPFTRAIDLATINPAKNLGLDNEIGSIKVGKKANITVIDKLDYSISLTIREGYTIYKQ